MQQINAAEVGVQVAMDLNQKDLTPSKGYFHFIPDEYNPRWLTIVRTGLPMGIAAFTKRLPDMVRDVHYEVVGSIHTDLRDGALWGLERGNAGVLGAHAEALRQARRACSNENFIYAVMHDPDTDGWWVTLAGPRRFKDWQALGLFSATTALFTDWSQLAAMQYSPTETDIGDLVKIDLVALLRNAGVSCKKLKRPPSWTNREATKPYFSRAGKERDTGPLDDQYLPVPKTHHVDHDTYEVPYLGEPGQVVAEDDMSPRVRELLQRSQVATAEPQVRAQPAQVIYEGADPDYVHPLLADRKPEGFWND